MLSHVSQQEFEYKLQEHYDLHSVQGVSNVLTDFELLKESIKTDIDNVAVVNILVEFEHIMSWVKLSERQQRIIRMYYFEGYSQTEIREIEGISQQAISKNIEKALEKIVATAWEVAYID